ncbi:MAG: EAL domain-containing protein [Eubacteriales bacterium]|nr:EAL domain-containing protein [Eubacteriales bacterium]
MEKIELQQMLDMAECGIFATKQDTEMELLYANIRFYEMLQYTPEEFQEKFDNRVLAAVLPEDKQKVRNLIARQRVAGGKLRLEFRAKRKNGLVAWISFSADSIQKDGQMIYFCSCMDITQAKRNLAEVYQAKREADLIANNIPGGVIKLRMTDFKLLYANDGFFRLAGYTKEEYHVNFGNHVDQVLHPDDRKMVQQQVHAALSNHGLIGFEYRIISKSGEEHWSYVNGCRVDDDEGQPVYLCVIMDITPRKQLEQELEDAARRSDILSDFMKITCWTYDIKQGKLSRSGNLIASYSDETVFEGEYWLQQIEEFIHPDEAEDFRRCFQERASEIGQSRKTYHIRNNNGDYQRTEVSFVSVSRTDGDQPDCIFGMTRVLEYSDDVMGSELQATEQMEHLENKLVHMAKGAQAKAEDTITNLLPYSQFLQQAGSRIGNRAEEERYAVFCADINEFRKYNYHYGFSISNDILKQFSGVLQKFIAKEGLCSRVDGDYFVGVAPYANHKQLLQSLSEMSSYQDNLNVNEEQQIAYSTTIGLYLVEPKDHELGEMLERADLARRSIKGMHSNVYAIYTEDLQHNQSREEDIIQQIWQAMKDQTVEICYLPRIQGDKENIIGCKAVTRIQLREGQYIESDTLQRYIERGGKLKEFAFYTLRHVCNNIGAWKAKGNEVIPFAVEVTARQLSRKNAVAMIDEIVVKRNKLEPSDLIFELPERYFANMTNSLRIALEQLCKRGYQVVISRFGSDHTAVQSLRDLPVTGIKFHGEYFGSYMTNKREQIILSSIVKMAGDLGMTVTCGGINTKLQEDYAHSLGIDILEGDMYYGAMRSNVFEKCFLME